MKLINLLRKYRRNNQTSANQEAGVVGPLIFGIAQS